MPKHPQPHRSVPGHPQAAVVPTSAPSARARLIINVFILSWLAWQLVVPLSYYLGDNVDDERFSWRMFSGVWLLQKSCSASVIESRATADADTPDMREVDLDRVLQGTWVNQLKKKTRPIVVEKFLRTRCENDPSVTAVEYIRTCSAAPSTRIPPVTVQYDCRAAAFAGP